MFIDDIKTAHARNRWAKLLIAFLVGFSFLFSMQSIPPLMSAIMKEYSISHATGSILMLIVALPAVFLSILGGFFTDRYGIRTLGSIGLILVCVGELLSAFSPSYSAFKQAGNTNLQNLGNLCPIFSWKNVLQ